VGCCCRALLQDICTVSAVSSSNNRALEGAIHHPLRWELLGVQQQQQQQQAAWHPPPLTHSSRPLHTRYYNSLHLLQLARTHHLPHSSSSSSSSSLLTGCMALHMAPQQRRLGPIPRLLEALLGIPQRRLYRASGEVGAIHLQQVRTVTVLSVYYFPVDTVVTLCFPGVYLSRKVWKGLWGTWIAAHAWPLCNKVKAQELGSQLQNISRQW
jgi:hypothetical protein